MFTPRHINYILLVLTSFVLGVMSCCDNNVAKYLSCDAQVLAEEPIKSEEEILQEADQEYWNCRKSRSDPDYISDFDILVKLNYTEFVGREHYTFPFGGKFGLYKYQKDYAGAVEYLREQLASLKPWESQGLHDNTNTNTAGYHHSGMAFHILLKQLGLALELNGQYEEALNVYMAVYSNNDLLWAKARIAYRLKLLAQEDPNFKPTHDLDFELKQKDPLFYVIIIVIQVMPKLCIEEVLERTKEYQELMQTHDEDLILAAKNGVGFGYLPVLHDTRDPDAQAAYRFRDNCARIMCPSLDAGAILNDEHGKYAITTRIAYTEFLKYAEEQYQKYQQQLQSFSESPSDWNFQERLYFGYSAEEVEKTMTLLRKIGELPY
ncbi:MAG: hypothetical protein Q4G03_05050 [Planctomycetia bacterium]|nr:hypothetical protein [Planctomycetia bacterium]